MVKHPIRINRNTYRGADPKKQKKAYDENTQIARLERAINEMLLKQTEPIQIYLYDLIAIETGMPAEFVRKHGYSIDCGGNGFTAFRHDMTYEEAMAATK